MVDAVIHGILQESRERWITAAEWDLLFIEAARFQVILYLVEKTIIIQK